MTPPAPPPPPPPGGDICIDGPNKPLENVISNVYYGTDEPTEIPLTPGQVWAIGNFFGCSGTVIAPTWVLTASHCNLRRGAQFCVGTAPNNPDVCFRAARVLDQPRGDMTLIELDGDATAGLPGLEPIGLLLEDLGRPWIGRIVEAAGYGRDERGRSGRREFTAEPIARLGNDTLTINGEGRHGVCFGDSGGPVTAIAADGSARIAGVLSNGDSSCVGFDNYTRVDVYRTWIEGYTGPTPAPGPQPCGMIDAAGRCEANTAVFCDGDVLARQQCGGGDVCAWDTAAGWRCVAPAADPCGGLTWLGDCDGGVLSWCDRGQLHTRDCRSCTEVCVNRNADVGHVCVPSACADGLDFQGRCDGDTAVWCNRDGEQETRRCSSNQRCAWVDEDTGYFCVNR